MEKYKVVKKLGDGTFGSVSQAKHLQSGEIFAIKKLKEKFFNWQNCLDLPETRALVKLNHPNIVKLYEVIKQKNELYLVFEYLDQNIYQLLKDRRRPLGEIEIRNIMFQTLQGLYYIHKIGYFHRDLKPENLLEFKGTIKIADFGLAKEINFKPPFTDYVSTRWYNIFLSWVTTK
jgi:protein kinase